MSKQIVKELPDLIQARVIDEEIAQRIKDYYDKQPSQTANRLFVVFGILGALLVGMGIVLIVAHNWDDFPKVIKLIIGFLPLLIGQIVAAFVVLRKNDQRGWQEGSAVFLFFSVAISISIVSQVYNIEGDLAGFLLTWMCLTLPIMYILRSSVAAMLLIIGITWYACETGYFSYPYSDATPYWILLVLVLPFYHVEFLRKKVQNNFYYFITWLLVMSPTICLGIFADVGGELIMIAYMSLFSGFVIMSQMRPFRTDRVLTNAYLVIGSLGIVISLLMLSFDWFWNDLADVKKLGGQPELIVSLVVTLAAGYLLSLLLKTSSWNTINSKSYAFIIFILLFFLGIGAPAVSQLLVNVVILVFAIHTIRDGAQRNHLGILNYGLIIMTALIVCRFFDTDFSFVVRGLLFIGVGVGFFGANYYMIKKRKKQA
jgi:uncharacterized membrane protein